MPKFGPKFYPKSKCFLFLYFLLVKCNLYSYASAMKGRELFHVLYVSSCKDDEFSRTDLDIIRASRTKNRQVGITGFLHREGMYYFQYLEGQKALVEWTFKIIRSDSRHFGVFLLSSGPIELCRFAARSMGYSDDYTASLGVIEPFKPTTISTDRLIDFFDIQASKHLEMFGI